MPQNIDSDYLLQPGQVFGRYTAERCLGKGGMGEVWLVHHNTLDVYHALKLLLPDIASPKSIRRFQEEAKLACRLKHPNLIEVHDAGTDTILDTKGHQTTVNYIAMEYVAGGSLTNRLEQCCRLASEPTLEIIRQVASALVEVHRQNIVHRDIKPDNIMFTDTGLVKLGDLGIAKSINSSEMNMTNGFRLGTSYYMSPEQMRDSSAVDIRADIYSLGCVAFEMLTGDIPYHGKNIEELYPQVVSPKEIPDVRDFVPDIPRKVAVLVANMCAKKLEKRIQTPAELIEGINGIIGKPAEETDRLYADGKKLIERMLDELWNGERFIARNPLNGEVVATDSALYYIPIVLGKRLPQEIIDKLTADLSVEGELLTGYGFASERLTGDGFRTTGMARGSVLAPVNLLVLTGLYDAGKEEFAKKVAQRYCRTLKDGGFNLMINPLQGNFGGFGCSWPACAFIILADMYSNM